MNTVSLARGQNALDTRVVPVPGTPASNEWPELRPLQSIAKSDPYPHEALPDQLRLAVMEVQQFTKAPVALVASSALASLSLVCQGLVDVRRAEGLIGPVGLFTLVIAESGERKSSSDGYFRKPIDQYERDQHEAGKPVLREYEKAQAAWDARVTGIKDRIRKLSREGKPTDAAERELSECYEQKPVRPRVPRLAYSDVTPEALAYGLATEWPSGGILSAEAGSVLGGHAMNAESIMRNMAQFNTLWDGNPLRVDRRTSESFVANGVRLTIGLQVQPQTLLAFFEKHGALARGIGFLARFLFSWPESTQGTRFFSHAPHSWPALNRMAVRLRQLLDTPVNIDNGALTLHVLSFSDAAQDKWIAIHDAIESELAPAGELIDVRDVASKAADNVARLAALFHVLRSGPSGLIQPEDVVRAGKIVTWHLQEAKRFFRIAMPKPATRLAIELDEFLVRRCRESGKVSISGTHALQYGPGALRQRAALDEVLAQLSSHGRVRLRNVNKTLQIDVHPDLLGGNQ